MAELTIEGVNEELYTLLNERAAENRRTLNDEVLVVLDDSVRRYRARCDRPSIEEIPRVPREPECTAAYEEFLERAINEGRV